MNPQEPTKQQPVVDPNAVSQTPPADPGTVTPPVSEPTPSENSPAGENPQEPAEGSTAS